MSRYQSQKKTSSKENKLVILLVRTNCDSRSVYHFPLSFESQEFSIWINCFYKDSITAWKFIFIISLVSKPMSLICLIATSLALFHSWQLL